MHIKIITPIILAYISSGSGYFGNAFSKNNGIAINIAINASPVINPAAISNPLFLPFCEEILLA